MHVFGQWEEAGVPGENPRIHGENMQTPHRKNQPGVEPRTLYCEATVLTTTPPCSLLKRFFTFFNITIVIYLILKKYYKDFWKR